MILMIKFIHTLWIVCFALCLVASKGGIAAPISLTCNASNVGLTSITTLTSSDNLLINHYDAQSCVGFAKANDDQKGLSSPSPNIGELNDGLLNGQTVRIKGKDVQYFTGNEFITPEQLLDLDNDGTATDPGWIHLANLNADDDLEAEYSSLGPDNLNIGDLLSFDISGCHTSDCISGMWTLTTTENIIEVVQSVLGRATFDHLALSIKASTSFVVYELDFMNIFATEIANNAQSALDFSTPYILSGTFNTNDLINGGGNAEGVSHMNIWVRDPTAQMPQPVNSPSVWFLFLSAIIWMIYRRYCNNDNSL